MTSVDIFQRENLQKILNFILISDILSKITHMRIWVYYKLCNKEHMLFNSSNQILSQIL